MPLIPIVKTLFSSCLGSRSHALGRKSVADRLTWRSDPAVIGGCDFSMSVVQANVLLEDCSQIHTGPHGTFIGVYDGHGGPEAARFIAQNLFPEVERCAQEEGGGMSGAVIKAAFGAVEEGFWKAVEGERQIAKVGSCCLLGVIRGNRLFVANLGDSRAVLGTVSEKDGDAVMAKRLCSEHNANIKEVRKELRDRHPLDPDIVVLTNGTWRVKGIIQVSRSIGDVYLKNPEMGPVTLRSGLSMTLTHPILTSEPSIHEYTLCSRDRFLIFASDGLWEQLTDQQAVDIVHNSSRTDVAGKLVQMALREAARKREVRYSDLGDIEAGVRRFFHDDISVVVVYLSSDSTKPIPSGGPSVMASPWYSSLASLWSRDGCPKIHAVGHVDAPHNVFPLCV